MHISCNPVNPPILVSMPSANAASDLQNAHNITCAECRRLRLRCDKAIPCQSCVRRGCPEMCPNGCKLTADGTKAVLAATKELHDTVKGLRGRIRDLETALNDLHVDRTGHTHPLLASAGVDQDGEEEVSSTDPVAELLNPMQKIALVRGRDGAHRIAAAHGRTWVTYSVDDPAGASSAPNDEMEHARVHYPGIQLRRWPFAPAIPIPFSTIKALQQRIPADDVLNALLDVFLRSLWSTGMAAAFSEAYIRDFIIPNARAPSGCAHTVAALASLFSILGIGALFAMDRGEAPEVETYGDLSWAALAGLDILSSPSVEVIEGLWIRCMPEFLRQDQMEERARVAMTLATHMCLALGLHRESTLFGLRPEVIERRRVVFWTVYTTDVWESFCTGRPATFTSSGMEFIDTKQVPAEASHGPVSGLYHTISNFAILVEMVGRASLSLKTPSYSEIMRLDRIVRNLDHRQGPNATPATLPSTTILLMHLHRAFYARALKEHGTNLHQSEYYYSFNAALRAARDTLSWANVAVRRSPAMCSRFHWMWSIPVNATMIYAVMLEHLPECEHAAECRRALKSSLELFKLGVSYGSGRAKQALTMFSNIQELGTPPSTHTSLVTEIPASYPVTADASSSIADTPDIRLKGDTIEPSKIATAGRGPPSRGAQYSVGISKQPGKHSVHRSRQLVRPHGPKTEGDTLQDLSKPLNLGLANPHTVDSAPFLAPWSLWKGQGWGAMDQSPQELTVPDSLDSFNPAVSESWLTSLGTVDSGWTGGLNGEWASSHKHL